MASRPCCCSGWDIRRILSRKEASRAPIDNYFVVFDVGLNSVYAAGWGVLAKLADELGDVAAATHCKQRQAKVEAVSLDTSLVCLPMHGQHLGSLASAACCTRHGCQVPSSSTTARQSIVTMCRCVQTSWCYERLSMYLHHQPPCVACEAVWFTTCTMVVQ